MIKNDPLRSTNHITCLYLECNRKRLPVLSLESNYIFIRTKYIYLAALRRYIYEIHPKKMKNKMLFKNNIYIRFYTCI